MKEYLQVNGMIFKLQEGEVITSVFVESDVITIEGYTPDCEFRTTYYPEETVSEWRGYGKHDIWTTGNCNIIHFIIEEEV